MSRTNLFRVEDAGEAVKDAVEMARILCRLSYLPSDVPIALVDYYARRVRAWSDIEQRRTTFFATRQILRHSALWRKNGKPNGYRRERKIAQKYFVETPPS